MYSAIMVPTEGSASEMAAISLGARLAQRFDAKLHLVRVHTVAPGIDPTTGAATLFLPEQALLEERVAAKERLESLAARCGRFGVVTSLEDGPIGPALRDYAHRMHVDLIVMSSHSRGGLSRVALGSITDYLMRHANIPVLVAREPATRNGGDSGVPFARIVVPLDGSALAEEILPVVAELASKRRSTVSLLHVLTPSTYSQHEIMQAGLPWWDKDIADAEAYLAQAASSLVESGLTVGKEVVLTDDVATAIIDYSTRTRADLVAIATRGIGGMTRMIFGTVADEVTRKCPSSVLVFHPKRAAEPGFASARSTTRAGVEG
jgi:nucleotide-binding universal stress UspA family protein